MSLQPAWIEERLTRAAREGRLAHAYLITGSPPEALANLVHRLAAQLLNASPDQHPDFHLLRPESKSRRITIEQVRTLEHDLQLKSYRGGLKIAAVLEADRMCLGRAEPANAFLKTLEEPPAHCLLFLTTETPDALLPTIRSRCLQLPLAPTGSPADSPHSPFAREWLAVQGAPIEAAYRRSALLQNYWHRLRESLPYTETDDADVDAALRESLFLRHRDASIATLIATTWQSCPPLDPHAASQICLALEDMRSALNRNIDAALAAEATHLRMAKHCKPL